MVVTLESPTKYSYNTETWTAPLLADLLNKEYGISYSEDMIYVILKKRLHLTHKKGKGFYPEANPEKRENFVADLKKNS